MHPNKRPSREGVTEVLKAVNRPDLTTVKRLSRSDKPRFRLTRSRLTADGLITVAGQSRIRTGFL